MHAVDQQAPAAANPGVGRLGAQPLGQPGAGLGKPALLWRQREHHWRRVGRRGRRESSKVLHIEVTVSRMTESMTPFDVNAYIFAVSM